ncbi:cyclophilin-like fold protein [Emticicia sp. W12TSBA100-4]|uniref:cyclophilin-like fold protein n=1 Tax=Emticicia sp. W12TSBA100-4 TaxID=3160965 RepID=UPI003306848E
MKRLILFFFAQLFIGFFVSCKAENQVSIKIMNENSNPISGHKLKIKVGDKVFTATLLDNATSKAFVAQLPLTIKMNELNNNEKFASLPQNVPTNATVPSSIQAGDLMMYGSSTLVLFYRGFSTSYSYTKIGKIDDVTGLVAALGTDDVTVSFEL